MKTETACPWAKSEMTPCVIKDGQICFALSLNNNNDNPICVGCGRSPEQIGVDAPKDWAEQIADYKARHNRKGKLVRRRLKGSA